MFLNVDPPFAVIFFALIAAWGIGQVLGLFTRAEPEDGMTRMPVSTKIETMLIAIMVAVLWLAEGNRQSLYGILILLGLIAGFTGDLIMARVIPLKHRLTGSMAAFAVNIVLIIAAAAVAVDIFTLEFVLVVLAGGIVGLAAWWFLLYDVTQSRAIRIGSLIYSMLMLAAIALTVYVPIMFEPGFMVLLSGVLLFASSDVILSQNLLHSQYFPWLHEIVWLLYSAGQLVIAFSIGMTA